MSTAWSLMVAGSECERLLEVSKSLQAQLGVNVLEIANIQEDCDNGERDMLISLMDVTNRVQEIHNICETFLKDTHSDLLFKR